MDVSIRGRSLNITERFESYVESKTDKIQLLLPKTQSFEVRVSRLADKSPQIGDRVEITVVGPGPVIRAESIGSDKYTAFDMAYGRILERVRKLKDRQSEHRGHGRLSLGEAAAHDFNEVAVTPAPIETIEAVAAGQPVDTSGQNEAEPPYSPVVIRSKHFPAELLSVEGAVDQMELVGHDFFLFVEKETQQPSVVYRRKGWNYGVISLENTP